MSNVANIERPSLIVDMARRYNMEPKAFAHTVRSTVVPKNATDEEFAAFLMVAKEYGLNPILKEIYAFPKQGGGIQPIVSVDGWANLINSHPMSDGVEFDDHLNDKGDLISITCRIYRKDRSRPVTATEYMSECKRNTPTWQQWPKRMLRHKALIQAARYAFGFAGIVDPDEAERFTVNPNRQAAPPSPPPVASVPQVPSPPLIDHTPRPDNDPERQEQYERFEAALDEFDTAEEVHAFATEYAPYDDEVCAAMVTARLRKIGGRR